MTLLRGSEWIGALGTGAFDVVAWLTLVVGAMSMLAAWAAVFVMCVQVVQAASNDATASRSASAACAWRPTCRPRGPNRAAVRARANRGARPIERVVTLLL